MKPIHFPLYPKLLPTASAVGLFLAGALGGAFAQGSIITVDNNPAHPANFRDVQAAHDAAADGDTLYIRGSQTAYGNLVVKKRLNLYGPGYFLRENEIPASSFASAGIGLITVTRDVDPFDNSVISKADGSAFYGLTLNGGISVQEPNVTVARCHLPGRFTSIAFSQGAFAADGSNGTVIGCFAPQQAATTGSQVSNVVVTNSILSGVSSGSTSNGIVVQNNVLLGSCMVDTADSVVANNIFTFTDPNNFRVAGQVKFNMVAAAASYLPEGPESPGNLNGINPVLVFVETGSPDSTWKLKEGSPAIGAGMNGVDMGAFGGATPYVLSGLPARPTVALDVGGTATLSQGLKIKVRAETRN